MPLVLQFHCVLDAEHHLRFPAWTWLPSRRFWLAGWAIIGMYPINFFLVYLHHLVVKTLQPQLALQLSTDSFYLGFSQSEFFH